MPEPKPTIDDTPEGEIHAYAVTLPGTDSTFFPTTPGQAACEDAPPSGT